MESVIEIVKDRQELKCRTCACCDNTAIMKIYLGNETSGHKQTQSIVLCKDHAIELRYKVNYSI